MKPSATLRPFQRIGCLVGGAVVLAVNWSAAQTAALDTSSWQVPLECAVAPLADLPTLEAPTKDPRGPLPVGVQVAISQVGSAWEVRIGLTEGNQRREHVLVAATCEEAVAAAGIVVSLIGTEAAIDVSASETGRVSLAAPPPPANVAGPDVTTEAGSPAVTASLSPPLSPPQAAARPAEAWRESPLEFRATPTGSAGLRPLPVATQLESLTASREAPWLFTPAIGLLVAGQQGISAPELGGLVQGALGRDFWRLRASLRAAWMLRRLQTAQGAELNLNRQAAVIQGCYIWGPGVSACLGPALERTFGVSRNVQQPARDASWSPALEASVGYQAENRTGAGWFLQLGGTLRFATLPLRVQPWGTVAEVGRLGVMVLVGTNWTSEL